MLICKNAVLLISKFFNFINLLINKLPKTNRPTKHISLWLFIAWTTNGQFARQFSTADGIILNKIGFYIVWLNQLFISIISFYIIGYFILPRYWYKQRTVETMIFMSIYWFSSSYETEQILILVNDSFGPAPIYVSSRVKLFNENSWLGYFINSRIFWFNWAHNFSYVLIPLLIKSNGDDRRRTIEMSILAQERIELELRFLQSQIRPHFLFNTLNNLYSLIRHKDAASARMLVDLSDILRYTIYQTKNDFVHLFGELHFLASYLRLEGVRMSKSKHITCHVNGDAIPYAIPPMILVTFIENGFKHGLNESPSSGYLNITITINDKDSNIILEVVNNKPEPMPFKKEVSVGGIGIVNVKKRLDLLFGNRYKLDITDYTNKFEVKLIMPLNKLKNDEILSKKLLEDMGPLPCPFYDQMTYKI